MGCVVQGVLQLGLGEAAKHAEPSRTVPNLKVQATTAVQHVGHVAAV